MRLRTQRSTRTDTLLPDTTLFRSWRDPPSGHQVRSCHFSLTGKAPHPHFTTERGHQTRYVMNRMPVATSLPPLVHPMRAWCPIVDRSEEHTSELQSLMRISYAVFCLKKKTTKILNATPRITY